MTNRLNKRGFSLVELVIVVVIIGVIAAIAVPRISRGAKGAGESAVKGSLASIRNAIDMYAAEHQGVLPGADGLEATLIDQLTKVTNAAGARGSGAGFIYGPYLRKGFSPAQVGPNPTATGVIMTTTTPIATAVVEATATAGWVYNYQTGELIINTNDPGESGQTYDTY